MASSALPRGLSFYAAGHDLAGRLYLAPGSVLSGAAALASSQAQSLVGGPLTFSSCRVLWREAGRVFETVTSLSILRDWARGEGQPVSAHVEGLLHAIGGRRLPFAGVSVDRPAIMGIVNVTPDSFSDGGRYFDTAAAVAHGLELRGAGADILDVGGESTRPGSEEVPPEEEMRRILPVVRALAEAGAVVSVDTRHAQVMGAAVEAGAAIINDISALTGDPQALRMLAATQASIVLMHMQGEPKAMQADPRYDFAPLDVYDYLGARVAACLAAGIAPERLSVDPGIGFGKTVEHNLQILARLGLYHGLGVAVLLGVSRKSFIGKLSHGEPPPERVPGSLAVALAGVDQGVQILRVHDVAETAQALAVWRGMRGV